MKKENYQIMVVDDEADTADLMASSISAVTNHKVFSFNDPKNALDFFMKSPVDLVITDLVMPNMDGFEMIKTMKDRSVNTDFMVITGNKRIRSVVHSRWLGVSYLFFKPVNIDELLISISTMYKRICYWESRLKEVGVNPA
ncbi:MAG: response regulator [Desulfobacterales bacterium]|nr:response regulator [Desulfobacterales bacterium]